MSTSRYTVRVFALVLLALSLSIAGCSDDSTGDNNGSAATGDAGSDTDQQADTADTSGADATTGEQLAMRWVIPAEVDKLEWEGGAQFCYEGETCEFSGVGSGSLIGGSEQEFRPSDEEKVVTGVAIDLEVTAGHGTLEVWQGSGGYFDFEGEIVGTFEVEAGNTYTDQFLLE